MMTLVERLRGYCHDLRDSQWLRVVPAMQEAADRIEQLEQALTEIIGLEPTARISTARYIARRALEGKLPEVLITPKVAALTVEHVAHVAPPKTEPSES